MKSTHTPLELAIRYACQRAHVAARAASFEASVTNTPRRSGRTQRISDSMLARLRMVSAEGAWADGIREAA